MANSLEAPKFEDLCALVEKESFGWWMNKVLISRAKQLSERQLGFSIPHKAWKEALRIKANYYTKQKRRRDPSIHALTERQWENLRRIVSSRAAELQGRTLEEATAIVGIDMPVTEIVLQGIRSEFQFWRK